jgi:predicted glycosyltransferase involved in capsule biosynthesis
MIDLSDVTFTIPIRIDFQERLENFILLLTYLTEKFSTNIIILEDDNEQKIVFDNPPQSIKYIFQRNEDPLFHKTKLINQLCNKSDTSIVAIYDCDILFSEEQYITSAELIRKGLCDLCLPSDGQVYEVERMFVRNIVKELSISSFPKLRALGSGATGGCVFYNKASFIRGGMANEHIKSWGCEDREMIDRFTKLGFKVKTVKGCLYHLEHPRGINSLATHPFYEQNCKELGKIRSINKNELENYIKTWEWLNFCTDQEGSVK